MKKALGWSLFAVVGSCALLIGFATLGVPLTLIILLPLWIVFAVKTGSFKTWQKYHRDGQQILIQRDAERLAEVQRQADIIRQRDAATSEPSR